MIFGWKEDWCEQGCDMFFTATFTALGKQLCSLPETSRPWSENC